MQRRRLSKCYNRNNCFNSSKYCFFFFICLYDGIKTLLSKSSDPTPVATNENSENNYEYEFDSTLDNKEPNMDDSGDTQPNNPTESQEPIAYQNYIEDISDKVSFNGSLIAEDQKDNYRYIPLIDGVYRFDTNLSSGGSVIVRISGENDKSIDYNYDALSIDLEAGKKYILSTEYRNGVCDYTVSIGIPIPIVDISDNPSSVTGNITYRDQKDKYYYTAPVTGTYRFDTNLSSGGSVIVRVSGENGKSIDYNYDALTINLESNKKYILSIEYRNSTCDYAISTGVPIPITDITGSSSVSGSITYQDQKDRYITLHQLLEPIILIRISVLEGQSLSELVVKIINLSIIIMIL